MSLLRPPQPIGRSAAVPDATPDGTPGAMTGRPRGAVLRRLLPVALIVLAVFIGWRMGAFHHVTLDGFLERREALVAEVAESYWLALGSFLLFYTVVVALSVPGGLILTISAGFLFGPYVGGAAAVVAATTGATILFLAARTLAGDRVRARLGDRLACFVDGFRRDAFSYLLALRLAPVAPFWLVNLVPALLGVPVRTFTVATFIGIIPATVAFACIGSGLDSVLEAQAAAKADCLAAGTCKLTLDKSALVTPGLLAALGALAVVALLPVVVKRVCGTSAP